MVISQFASATTVSTGIIKSRESLFPLVKCKLSIIFIRVSFEVIFQYTKSTFRRLTVFSIFLSFPNTILRVVVSTI